MMENVKAWGVCDKITGKWRGINWRWAFDKNNQLLQITVEGREGLEVREIPDEVAALHPKISEAMIRRAKMLYWDAKIACVKVNGWRDV